MCTGIYVLLFLVRCSVLAVVRIIVVSYIAAAMIYCYSSCLTVFLPPPSVYVIHLLRQPHVSCAMYERKKWMNKKGSAGQKVGCRTFWPAAPVGRRRCFFCLFVPWCEVMLLKRIPCSQQLRHVCVWCSDDSIQAKRRKCRLWIYCVWYRSMKRKVFISIPKESAQSPCFGMMRCPQRIYTR